MIRILFMLLLWAGPISAQEAQQYFGNPQADRVIRLRTTTDIAIFAPTVQDFVDLNPSYAIRYEQWGSNDLFQLTENDCRQGQIGADIVISSGVHQMVKLVNDNCAAPWQSFVSGLLPDILTWRNEVFGITQEPAVMVYNKDLIAPQDVPQTRFDLLDMLRPQDSVLAGKVATYDINASGLGFLFAFMDSQQASTFGALMEAFARTGAVATCCSSEIIAGVRSGQYLIAYNVLGSYAQTVARDDPSLGIIEPQDYTLVLSRAAILPGQVAKAEAGQFLDYLLSERGQRIMSQSFLVARPQRDEPVGLGPWRPVELSPALLVAMDAATVARFKHRWDTNFSRFPFRDAP